MQCDNAQCGRAELIVVTVYTCKVCGRSHTADYGLATDPLEDDQVADDYGSDDCED